MCETPPGPVVEEVCRQRLRIYGGLGKDLSGGRIPPQRICPGRRGKVLCRGDGAWGDGAWDDARGRRSGGSHPGGECAAAISATA